MKWDTKSVLTFLFSLFWIFVIFIDFWFYNPGYSASITNFQYWDTMAVLAVMGGGIFFLFKKNLANPMVARLTSGLGILILFLLIAGIILWFHYGKLSGEILEIGKGLSYLGKVLLAQGAAYLVFGACYAAGGTLLNGLFDLRFEKLQAGLIKTALGITIISMLLTVLAAVGLLTFPFVLGVLLLSAGLGYQELLNYFKYTLWHPVTDFQKVHWLSFLSIFSLLIFIALNSFGNIRPFPFGFDALVLYLNLPNLLSEKGAMIVGYSPYYWSLFISIGHIIFNKIEVVIALSVAGGILSAIATYSIARKWISAHYALLTALLFYSLPLVNYQSYRDIKTDLGLLFILLCLVMVLIRWLETEQESEKLKDTQKGIMSSNGLLSNFLTQPSQLIVLLGVLSGMAMGIKLTGLIAVFGVLSVFSYVRGGEAGFLTNFALTFFVVLAGKLDTSLRAYHFGADSMMWFSLFAGLIGLAWMTYKTRQQVFILIKNTVIYLAFVGLVYAPWPIKNYQETGEVSIKTLIEGKSKADVIRDFYQNAEKE